MLSLALNPDQPVIRHRWAKYGAIERFRRGDKLTRKRPTEVDACHHLEAPDAPAFMPAALVSSRLICSKCGKRKPREAFGKDARCVTRGGRRTECNPCRSEILKQARLKQRQERRKTAKAGV